MGIVLIVGVVTLAWFCVKAFKSLISTDRHGAERTEFVINSAAVGQELPVQVVVPEGAEDERRPLLVFLHGRGENGEDSNLDEPMYEALANQGVDAPIVAFPNGGLDSYWHNRDTGNWMDYVVREVIPEVTERFNADPGRVAIGGISMGGFGAYDIARLNPGRFCAVGGHSPAIWQDGAETAPGAFDDAEDFEEHDIVAVAQTNPDPWMSPRLWIDRGDEDPFVPGTDAFSQALESAGADITVHHPPGAHEGSYWDEHWPDYMRFYATALARC